MLVSLIVASLVAATPRATAEVDTQPLLKAVFHKDVPRSDDDVGRLAGTKAARCADGTVLLVVVTGTGAPDSPGTYTDSATVYSLRMDRSRWKVIDKLDLAEPSKPDEPIELEPESIDLGKGVRGTTVRFMGENESTEYTRWEGTLFVVLPNGKFGAPFKCNTDKDCEFRGTAHGVEISQNDTGDGEDPTMSSTDTYQWDGSKFVEQSDEDDSPEQLIASATASSTLVEKGLPANYYVPAKAFDDVEKTAWAEGVPGPGVGQWIEFKLTRPVKVTNLSLLAGCGATPARRSLNERLKTLKVTGDGADAQVVSLRDVTTAQDVAVKFSKPITTLKLEIVAVYPGTKFQDACLSEISVEAQ